MTVAEVLQDATTSPSAPADRRLARRAPDAVLAIAVAALVAAAAIVPLLFNPWFYFYADTPEGAYGQWYALGQQLTHGEWPLLSVEAWRAGNWIAEGQWGLWNPLVLGMGFLVYLSPSALLASNLIKIFFLALGAAGTFLWARHYRARPGWSFLAGVAAPFAGFTLFMDATSWVTNLMVWAFFPWLAFTARRFAFARRGLAWLLLIGYLLVTIGYVQGTIMGVLLFLALLIETAIRRRGDAALRLVLSGAVLGLIAVAVYLPGILTAPVTSRSSTIGNDGFMVYTFTALATGATPSALADLLGWWGRFPTVPYTYLAWFLPLLALVDGRRVRSMAPQLSGLGVFLTFALAYSMAPSVMGPLQFPSRTVPWIAVSLIVLTCVLLSRARASALGSRWIPVVLLWALGLYLSLAQTPQSWRSHLAFGVFTLGALLLALWMLYRRRSDARVFGVRTVTAVMTVVTLAILVVQSAVFADRLHSRMDFPDDVDEYRDSLAWGEGDGFVVGVAPVSDDAALDESLVGNFWYLSDTHMHNLYSPVQFRLYSQDLCMSHDGTTCPAALETLTSTDSTTGVPLLDLLSLDTIQVVATEERPLSELASLDPPTGWEVADVGDFSVTWTRTAPTQDAGGVVWTSPGLSVEVQEADDTHVTFRVDGSPSEGSSVVFSRLAWPGYSVDGAELDQPLRGYLLSVDVSEVANGDVVTVTFHPPGWSIVLASLSLAAGLAIVLLIAYRPSRARRSRQRARRSQVATNG